MLEIHLNLEFSGIFGKNGDNFVQGDKLFFKALIPIFILFKTYK